MRTTWKFTALANVGTRTTPPAITGTPTKSSSMRSGAIVAGAAPTHNGDKRTATACSCSTRRHRHLFLQSRAAIAAAGAVNLDHAFESIVGKLCAPYRDCAAGDLQHVARSRAQPLQVGWRQPRNRVADVFHTRLRHAQCQRRRRRRFGDFRHGLTCNLLRAWRSNRSKINARKLPVRKNPRSIISVTTTLPA